MPSFLKKVLMFAVVAGSALAAGVFPWPGHYADPASGLDITLSSGGSVASSDDGLQYPAPFTTVSGITYHTTAYQYVPAAGCSIPVPVEIGYDEKAKVLRLEYTLSNSASNIFGQCSGSQDRVEHYDLVKSNSAPMTRSPLALPSFSADRGGCFSDADCEAYFCCSRSISPVGAENSCLPVGSMACL